MTGSKLRRLNPEFSLLEQQWQNKNGTLPFDTVLNHQKD